MHASAYTLACTFSVHLPHPNPCFAHGYRLDRLLDERSVVTASRGYRPLIKLLTHPGSGKITFKYNTMCYFVSVSSFTAYIIFTFSVRVRVSVGVRVKVRVLRLWLGLVLVLGYGAT